METIKCIKCGENKELDSFSNNKAKRSGKNNTCKACHSIYRKKYYLANKDKERKGVDEYRKNRPEAVKKRQARYSKKAGRTISVKCNRCGKDTYASKTDLVKNSNHYCGNMCYRATLKGTDCFLPIIFKIRKRSKTKGLDMDIDRDYLENIFTGKCAISGISIKIYKKDEKLNLIDAASLDRIDNSKGYIKGNVQWVNLGVNYMKNRHNNNDLIKLIKLIQNASVV